MRIDKLKLAIIILLNLMFVFSLTYINRLQLNFTEQSGNKQFLLEYALDFNHKVNNTINFSPSQNDNLLQQISFVSVFGSKFSINMHQVVPLEYMSRLFISANKFVSFRSLRHDDNEVNPTTHLSLSQYTKIFLLLFISLVLVEFILFCCWRFISVMISKIQVDYSNFAYIPLSSTKTILNEYKEHIIGVLLIVASIILFTQGYFSHYIDMNNFYNSDELFLLDLFNDLSNHGSFANWYLTQTTFFFPDYIMFAVIYPVIKNPYYLFFSYACLQIIIFYLLLYALIAQITNRKSANYLSGVLTFFIVFGGIFFQSFYAITFLQITHFGAFLNELLLLVIVIKLYDNKHTTSRNKLFMFYVFMAMLFIAVVSDPMILIWFLMPLAITLFLLRKKHDKIPYIKIIAVVGITCVAMWLFHTILHRNYLAFRFWPLLIFMDKIALLKKLMYVFFAVKENWRQLAIIIGVVLMLALLITKNFQLKQILNRNRVLKLLAYFYLCTVFTVFMMLIVITHFVYEVRYILPIVFISSMIVVVFLQCLFPRLILLVILGIFCTASIKLARLPFYTAYYPPHVACIDSALTKYNVRFGISGYFEARAYNYTTQVAGNIVPVNSPFSNQIKTDVKSYLWEDTITHARNSYDFALVNTAENRANKYDLDTKKILSQNKQYITSVDCPGYKLIIFAKDQLINY